MSSFYPPPPPAANLHPNSPAFMDMLEKYLAAHETTYTQRQQQQQQQPSPSAPSSSSSQSPLNRVGTPLTSLYPPPATLNNNNNNNNFTQFNPALLQNIAALNNINNQNTSVPQADSSNKLGLTPQAIAELISVAARQRASLQNQNHSNQGGLDSVYGSYLEGLNALIQARQQQAQAIHAAVAQQQQQQGQTSDQNQNSTATGSSSFFSNPNVFQNQQPQRQTSLNSNSSISPPALPQNSSSASTGSVAAQQQILKDIQEQRDSSPLSSTGGMANKRKASEGEIDGHPNNRRKSGGMDDDEDDESSDEKRRPKKSNSSSSRRKSATTAEQKKLEDQEAKQLRRKQQNRIAQERFRERREQRVKDLEDKVAELENKNMGQSIENENLRELLKKLQKENMELKNKGFTFRMPLPGQSLTPVSTRDEGNNSSGESPDSQKAPAVDGLRADKLPSPPLSMVDSRSQSYLPSEGASPSSIIDIGSRDRSESNAESSNKTSPASTNSQDSPAARSFTFGGNTFTADPFNAFAGGLTSLNAVPDGNQVANKEPEPASGQLDGLSKNVDVQEIFAALSKNFRFAEEPEKPQQPAQPAANHLAPSTGFQFVNLGPKTPYTMVAEAPEFMSYQDSAALNSFSGFDWGSFGSSIGAEDQTMLDDAGMEAFLSSLTSTDNAGLEAMLNGNNDVNMTDQTQADLKPPAWLTTGSTPGGGLHFGSELFMQYLKNSPNTSAGLKPAPTPTNENNAFSPSNYFSFSPEAMNSSSSDSLGMVITPSTTDSGAPVKVNGAAETKSENCVFNEMQTMGPDFVPEAPMAKVIGKDGRPMTAGQMWAKVQEKVDFANGFDVEDLCEQFKAKAVCHGQGPEVDESALESAIDAYIAEQAKKRSGWRPLR